MKKINLKKSLKNPFLSKKEKEYWKPKLNYSFYLLEILETQFPNWVLPGDFKILGMTGSKIEHLIEFENYIKLLCETGLIESENIKFENISNKKYRITFKGIEFLNNIRLKNLNKQMLLLTIILSLFGLIQICSILINSFQL